MEDITYTKSTEAGNYRFNPFCDAVETYIQQKNGKDFDFHFEP